ncbi:hypothetical protein G6L37_06325 [Agrobacterium rubi]|nr:hypothetical protein [Agrobacterium rubi]NTF24978.1 hypothetical protein [Agrobacterium rubi]
MGTRHLVTIVKDGEFKLAQYGQWDGYPSGQGVTVVEFFNNGDVEALKANVDKLRYIDDEQADALYQTIGIPSGQEWLNMDQSAAIKNTFPTLHRDIGAGILEIIASGRAELQDDSGSSYIPTANSLAFAGGFGCEWVHTIDLDKGTYEIYEGGFEAEGEPNRFTDVLKKEYEGSGESPSFVTLKAEYSLDAMPTWQEFLAELAPEALQRRLDWLAHQAAEDEKDEVAAEDQPTPDPEKPTWAM